MSRLRLYDVTGYKMFSADIGVENHQIAADGGVLQWKAKFKALQADGSIIHSSIM